ncbi:MAG TPA: hypothetical protein VNT51_04660, partial [Miltoncostaeaceae bacterium]|nr:hypothetical protein [Miltoncostaeaceae bacterium]
ITVTRIWSPDDDCNVIFGAVIDESSGDQIRVTVIATGFDTTPVGEEAAAPAEQPRQAAPTERGPAPSTAPPAAAPPGRRPTVQLDQRDRSDLEIPDDALDIPDFLKGR